MPESAPDSAKDSRERFMLFGLALLVLSILPALLIDFPAGDSWTHGWTVRQWLDGKFVLNDWSSAIALPQQILGWLVHIGTDNVHWVRLSILTMLVTVAGCLVAARLPSKLFPGIPNIRTWSPFFAILILAQTFTMKIASGFMTDGYYFILLAASLWMLLEILRNPGEQANSIWIRRWIGFAALATLAALQRTHGITLLVIVGAWVLFARIIFLNPEEKRTWAGIRGWLPVILCAVGIVFTLIVLADPSFSPARSGEVADEIKNFWTGKLMSVGGIAKDRMWLAFGIVHHIGFALLPLTLIARVKQARRERKEKGKVVNWWYVVFGTIFLLLTVAQWANGDQWDISSLFPYVGNSLTAEGFGPRADTIALTAGHLWPIGFRLFLSVISTVGGMLLIWLLSRSVRIRGIDWRSPSALIGLIALAHIGLILLNLHFFDRYLLPLIPFALCWLAPFLGDAGKRERFWGWIIVGIYFLWSMWGTADALGWTNAKWDLAERAREQGIPSDQLVAGYEPDGYFNYTNEAYPGLPTPEEARDMTVDPRLPWWVNRLGLRIEPAYVIMEKGAQVGGTPWREYVPTDIENDRMQVWAHP